MVLPASKDSFMLKQPSRAQLSRRRVRNRVHAALARRTAPVWSFLGSRPWWPKAVVSIGAITFAGMIAGCALPTHPDSDAPPTDPYNPAATQLLDDTQWDLTGWTDANGQPRAVPKASDAGGPITLNLSTDGGQRKLNGFSGCNRYMGAYELAAGKLTVESIAGTRMACAPGPGPTLEQSYLKGLTGIARTGVQMRPPKQLQLTLDNGDVMTFVEHAK
jgi:heat shock protein HslJ